jgi:hypothetical protein
MSPMSRLRYAVAAGLALGSSLVAGAWSPSEGTRADTRTALVEVICQGMPTVHGDPTVDIIITQTFIGGPFSSLLTCDPNDPATRVTRYRVAGLSDADDFPITVELFLNGSPTPVASARISHGGGTLHYFDHESTVGITVAIALAKLDE